jgi:hypothetical protein
VTFSVAREADILDRVVVGAADEEVGSAHSSSAEGPGDRVPAAAKLGSSPQTFAASFASPQTTRRDEIVVCVLRRGNGAGTRR